MEEANAGWKACMVLEYIKPTGIGAISSDSRKTTILIIRIEDLDFETYAGKVAPFLGFAPTVSQSVFSSLADEKPNSLGEVRSISSWNDQERKEFLNEVKTTATVFGYDAEKVLTTSRYQGEPSAPSGGKKPVRPGSWWEKITGSKGK